MVDCIGLDWIVWNDPERPKVGPAGARAGLRVKPAMKQHGEMAERFKAPVLKFVVGRVAEWSIALVLKTSDGQPSVGSNPTPSANKNNALRVVKRAAAKNAPVNCRCHNGP